MRILLYDDQEERGGILKNALEGAGFIVDLETLTDIDAQDAADLMSMEEYAAVLPSPELTDIFRAGDRLLRDRGSKAAPNKIFNNDIPLGALFNAVKTGYGHGTEPSPVIEATLDGVTLSIDIADRKNCFKDGEALKLTNKEHALLTGMIV